MNSEGKDVSFHRRSTFHLFGLHRENVWLCTNRGYLISFSKFSYSNFWRFSNRFSLAASAICSAGSSSQGSRRVLTLTILHTRCHPLIVITTVTHNMLHSVNLDKSHVTNNISKSYIVFCSTLSSWRS